jgi:glycosyltransferase involved in cell wall biosynthesis
MHWLEFYDAVRDAALVARDTGRAFVWTVTSGGAPIDYYGLNRVVVFTREVAEDARRRSPGTAVHVLPARIDFRPLTPEIRARARREIRQTFGLADDDLLVVRVARCAKTYLRSVRLGLALAGRLGRDGRRAAFLHAGFAQEPDVAREIRRLVEQANADAGRTIAHSVTEPLEAGTRYAAAADVCLGSGRTAIEAIALERPTLVAWGARYLGLVDASNIAAMADTNFQGRWSQRVVSDEDVVEQMHDALRARLADGGVAARVQASCAQFVRERHSVERAAEVYERLYADRTVTVAGALAHFGNPQHLGREILRRLPAGLADRGIIGRLRRARASAMAVGANE